MAEEIEKSKIDILAEEIAELNKRLDNQIKLIAEHEKDIKHIKKELFL